MSRSFIHDDFLLGNEPARQLYHQYAANQPIIDFHNHLIPSQIAANHEFGDLFEIWLAGDHYKWRAMRANGISEPYITGNAFFMVRRPPRSTPFPYTLRNPLYHWTHLELTRHFGFTDLLEATTAEAAWNETKAQLPKLRVHDILRRFDVRVLCTTDDPADPLDDHIAIRKSGLKTRVYPSFRPDKALKIHQPDIFNPWLECLEQVSGMTVHTFDDLVQALKKRHDDFHAIGCRISDHGMDTCYATPCSHAQASQIFKAVRGGKACTPEEQAAYASFLMLEFGRWDAARNWAMELHLGAMGNNNSRMMSAVGPNTGFDTIGDSAQARPLVAFLDALDRTEELPRTIIFNINPADNYLFACMIGNFQDGKIPGKIQMGSGWWFLDQKEAMEWQMNALSNLGLFRRFVGMVTDSRSMLSFPRHEYFRRVLCNLVGQGIASGELPSDLELSGEMVREICFSNARNYFDFEPMD